MRIAFDFVATNIGSGTKTYLINFCNNLSLNKSQNEVFIFICKNYIKYLSVDIQNTQNIKFIIKPNYLSKAFFRIIWMQLFLPFELKILKIRKLYSPMNIAPLICRFLKIKNILTLHSNLPWKYFNMMPGNYFKKILTKKIMEISISLCDVLIVNSEYAKKEIENILNLKNKSIYVVYLGLDPKYKETNSKNNYLNRSEFKNGYFLSVLSCVRYHNIINLLKAYKKICDKSKTTPNYCLVMQILDKDYFIELEKFIKKNMLEKKITILTNLSTNNLIGLYKKAKLYIFSSYCEVFGLTTIEAMSQGCPVLVSKSSALPEINNSAAEYFDPDDYEDLSTKLEELTLDQKKRNNLKKKGIEWSENFSWKKNTKMTFEIITKV